MNSDTTSAKQHLICLPYAGGGSHIYRSWPAFLPPSVKVYAPCLPGRGERALDTPLSSMDALIQDLSEKILPLTDSPYALFGHSMGAFIAFELARAMRRQGAPAPVHLFVAAQRGPRLPYPYPVIYHLSDEEFLAGVFSRYGQTIPEGVLEDSQMRKLVLASLRADFAVVETYSYRPESLLTCPITAFGGQGDDRINASEIETWQAETTASFTTHMLPGGHFFVDSDKRKLTSLVGKALASTQKIALAVSSEEAK